jgi:cytochrome P450 / NADPH-cytochrome P450 reductase
LSFTFYELVSNPEVLKTAQEKVDPVLGRDRMTVEHVTKIPYISAIIREILRLHPIAPSFTVTSLSEDPTDYPMHVGKQNYRVERGDKFNLNLNQIQRDPTVYGADADDFKPERMLDENFKKLPRNAWKVSQIYRDIYAPKNIAYVFSLLGTVLEAA